jgi:6-phosphofructokinase 1
MSDPLSLFLSFNFDHERFASLVCDQLRSQPGIETFFYTKDRTPEEWKKQIRTGLNQNNTFVLFLGSKLGNIQGQEMNFALWADEFQDRRLWVQIASRADERAREYCEALDPIRLDILKTDPSFERLVKSPDPLVEVTELTDDQQQKAAEQCAREIVRRLQRQWATPLDLPEGYPFDYEKNIIDAFIEGGGRLPPDKLEAGCTATWPTVEKHPELNASGKSDYYPNPVPEEVGGSYRAEDASIVVDARAQRLRGKVQEFWATNDTFLTFPEAGPRKRVCHPRKGKDELRVGILVSGGIAPGINAVIHGIVNRHTLYAQPSRDQRPRYKLEVLGFEDGLQGLLHGDQQPALLKTLPARRQDLTQALSESTHAGGSFLRTSREDDLLTPEGQEKVAEIVRKLTQRGPHRVDILYILGGDGSMRAAHAIQTVAQRRGVDLSVVTVPKTMDNDILWVWQSFGFLSAVERAKDMILQLKVEAESNPRLCVIQLFGSDSGFVASHAALASNACDYVLVPEVGFNMRTLIQTMVEKLQDLKKDDESPHGVVVMAETPIPRDYQDFYRDVGLSEQEIEAVDYFVQRKGRVQGQTPDRLRSAALKIVSGALQNEIRKLGGYWSRFRVFTNEPRHLIRAIPPSTADFIFGERLGTLAVDAAMAGYSDCMVSQWLTEYVLVPLKLVVLGRKRLPPNGIFWRTVISSTGQPDEILPDWSK